MKDLILSEIKRLAMANGEPPGQKLFARETGIGDHNWRGKFWARWGDALLEAGYEPNKWVERLNSIDVLNAVIFACRHYRRFPTQDEITLLGKSHPNIPHPNVIKGHLGSRSEIIAALAKHARDNEGFSDVAEMLPDVQSKTASKSVSAQAKPDGWVYLFKSGDFYKIGRSDDLERRIKEVGIKLPEKLTPIHSIRTDDPPGIEAYWHRRFADKRSNGEWFKLSSLDISAFKKRKYQ